MILTRNHFHKEYVEGEMTGVMIDVPIYMLEQNWTSSLDHRGGLNFESCVPNGRYDLLPYKRSNGDLVFRLIRASLNVYSTKRQARKSGGGRWDILAHSANYPTEIVGCMAPGLSREPGRVWSSRDAMKILMKSFESIPVLVIKSYETLSLRE